MKLFNIFRKKSQQEAVEHQDNSKILSSITFSIDETSEIFVDINLSETDEATLSSLASNLAMVASPEMPVMVLEMIKNSLLQDGKTSEYIDFVGEYMIKTASVLEDYGQNVKDEPFIKPSDMI